LHEALPEDALLNTYRGGVRPERWGAYGDCFSVTIDRSVNLAEFVFSFYTSPVFQIERWLLRVFVGTPSNNAAARALADGVVASFAVWYVGERTHTQLLMCDRDERTGTATLGGGLRILMRFHVLYSKVLLHAAKVALLKRRAAA
jgi:hypothetical protein